MQKYNPYAVRRHVRHQFTTPDGLAVAVTKSFTKPDNDDAYNPSVDLATGSCECNCPDFLYRKASQRPDLTRPETLCKHLSRYVANLERRGEIQPERKAFDVNDDADRAEAIRQMADF